MGIGVKDVFEQINFRGYFIIIGHLEHLLSTKGYFCWSLITVPILRISTESWKLLLLPSSVSGPQTCLSDVILWFFIVSVKLADGIPSRIKIMPDLDQNTDIASKIKQLRTSGRKLPEWQYCGVQKLKFSCKKNISKSVNGMKFPFFICNADTFRAGDNLLGKHINFPVSKLLKSYR